MDYSKRLNKLIPGGAHTYSRGDDQFPGNAPQILSKGEGPYVWDEKGSKYLDYGMALRAVTLGYSNPEVNRSAYAAIESGNNLTRSSMIELQAAELITDLIPNAEMVKFAKNGSTVTSAAVKLARAYTGKKYIVRCFDHPFFSYDDWFIGNTIMTKGVPPEISSLTLNFKYNDIESLRKVFASFPNEIACVIMEPATTEEPKENFLQLVKDQCHNNGALFILDEMITGFRYHIQGCQKLFNIDADLVTFGKGMANGFSVAALTGRRDIMELGSIKDIGSERVFLVSTTHGAEMCGLAAFIKTIEIYQRDGVVEKLWSYGNKLAEGVNQIAKDIGIQDYFSVEGFPCSPVYITKNKDLETSLEFRTLFSQEMIKNKILMPWIAVSSSHEDKELDMTLEAVRSTLNVYERALEGDVRSFVSGDIIKPVFRSHN